MNTSDFEKSNRESLNKDSHSDVKSNLTHSESIHKAPAYEAPLAAKESGNRSQGIFNDLTNTSTNGNNYWQDLLIYVGRIREFSKNDWIIYLAWVGMMVGLFASLMTFVSIGRIYETGLPYFTWNIPAGALIFTVAIAIDTIGHRTVYKEELRKGESLIHGITIFCGVTSIMFLCFAKDYPETFRYPALVLIVLSFFYSIIDEALHWVRYLNQKSDRIEMWSHFGIFLGHSLMTISWWVWFDSGYSGVEETFSILKF